MNCKPGDLAVIVRSWLPQAVGNLCEVVSLDLASGDWVINPLFKVPTATAYLANDRILRPIRNTPGEDETLQWAPVPGEKVTA